MDFSEIPLFDGIEEQDLKNMLLCINPRIANYKKDEYVVIAGDELNTLGIVLEGEVSIVKENIEGNRMIVTVLGEGDMFGEVAAFSSKKKWPANVVAQKDSKVMFIPPQKIVTQCERACFSHRTLIVNMLKIISDKAIILNKKVEYLAMKSLRGKISHFIFEEYKKNNKVNFKISLSRNELAEFLNVSRPSLSREMCNMRDEGIIDFDKSNIVIKNIQAIKNKVE
ncbi:MAG: Crp/Fnr family transcriptional regulator [Clostridiaceae bacterium]